jgi:hypothetical protein
MAKKKSKWFPWSKAGSDEIKKFTDHVEHCRHFAETIARKKEHPAVTEEDGRRHSRVCRFMGRAVFQACQTDQARSS